MVAAQEWHEDGHVTWAVCCCASQIDKDALDQQVIDRQERERPERERDE